MVQTIDMADTLNRGKTTAKDIITIFLHEACHRVILKAETKAGEALAAYANNKKSKGGDSRKGKKWRPKCFNCHKLGHKLPDCFAPGGGKEDQALQDISAITSSYTLINMYLFQFDYKKGQKTGFHIK